MPCLRTFHCNDSGGDRIKPPLAVSELASTLNCMTESAAGVGGVAGTRGRAYSVDAIVVDESARKVMVQGPKWQAIIIGHSKDHVSLLRVVMTR